MASKNLIAVGSGVAKVERPLFAQGSVELDRTLLNINVFQMLQREVEEEPLDGMQDQVISPLDPLEGKGEGWRVGGKGLGLAAVDIAGELIHTKFTPKRAANELQKMLDCEARERCLSGCDELRALLSDAKASQRAAEAILTKK